MSQKNDVYVSRTVRTMAIITFLTSLVWTAVSIYSAVTKPAEIEIKPEMLTQVNPSLDTDTLTLLTQKRQLTEDPAAAELLRQMVQLSASQAEKARINEIAPVTTLTPTPSETPVSTDSGDGAL